MANIQVNFKNNYLLISVLLKPMVFDATELIIIHTSNSMGKHVTKDWYYIVRTFVHIKLIEVRLLLTSVTFGGNIVIVKDYICDKTKKKITTSEQFLNLMEEIV